MARDSTLSVLGDGPPILPPLHLHHFPLNDQEEETPAISPETEVFTKEKLEQNAAPSDLRQNLFLICITLTQLVQMIPLGVGINSGLALGKALGAPAIDSVWIVASYPLTQGSFVLIGMLQRDWSSPTTVQKPSD